MSKYNFTVDLDILKQRNVRLKNIAAALENNVTTVMTHVNNVNTGWTGTNSDEYVRVFTELKPKMDKKVEFIRTTTELIDKTITIVSDVQQNIGTGIKNLS